MFRFIIVLHIIACIIPIFLVLIQRGKGADIGAAFGGASQTVFGSAGPEPFLGKLTTVIAAIFMITSLSIASLSKKSITSPVTEGMRRPIETTAPVEREKEAPQKETAQPLQREQTGKEPKE